MTSQKEAKLFGTDGIRGKAGVVLTPQLALAVGQAAGVYFRGDTTHRGVCLIGKDTRRSGYMLEQALTAGFLSVGIDVLQVGPVPTPALAMLVPSMRCAFGVMITASHNGFVDNGIKLFGPTGHKLDDAAEQQIERLVGQDLSSKFAVAHAIGRATRIDDASGRYVESVKGTVPKNLELTGLRVVIDCAHGAAYKVAPKTLQELGADVVAIGVDPNGVNINDGFGSTSPERLIAMVRERRADVGIALDGDADRVQLVDEEGALVDGDQMLAAIARDWHERSRLKNPVVVGTVMSNLGFERYLANSGISLVRAAVGDRYVLEEMRKHEASLGGEPSGHIILAEHATTGDGLMAALQVLAIMSLRKRKLSEVCRLFTPVPQILKNLRYSGASPLERPSVAAAVEAGTERLKGTGRVLVRLSGTEPLVRVMAEGDDAVLVRSVVDAICREVEAS